MASFSLTRRHFLHTAAAAALLSQTPRGFLRGADKRSADRVVQGKHAGLLVHNDQVGEIETPLELLRQHAITPKEILFVRNNQVFPGCMTTAAPKHEPWQITFSGLIIDSQPKSVSLEQLREMERVEHVVVLQCSGNGRNRFSKAAKVSGAPWSVGAMGNVKFSGVSIASLMNALRIPLFEHARYVTVLGRDTPEKEGAADFEHSLPLADVLERSLLALEMNGEPIPAVHGGPVRLITPGYYGTMNVKWVTGIRFDKEESANYHHVGRYRTPLKPLVPGSEFESTLANSEPNWNMKIKSVFFTPDAGQQLPAGQPVKVTGVAWNDGQAQITSVELSPDAGQTWHGTTLGKSEGPYAWQPWEAQLTLKPGEHTLLVRAVDALGRTQPFDGSIAWNPAGYTWSGIEALPIRVG